MRVHLHVDAHARLSPLSPLHAIGEHDDGASAPPTFGDSVGITNEIDRHQRLSSARPCCMQAQQQYRSRQEWAWHPLAPTHPTTRTQ